MWLKSLWRRLIRQHRGMIRPGMGMGFDDSAEIMRSKSAEMVFYLRARRTMADYTESRHVRDDAIKRKRWARKAHLGEHK